MIEGNVMRINREYQLDANEILTETLLANEGQTYRIIAEEPNEVPPSYGDSYATAAVENCQPVSNFPTGYFMQFSNYDGEPYREISCNAIIGSYDPNDKTASPVGYDAPHYIEADFMKESLTEITSKKIHRLIIKSIFKIQGTIPHLK